MAEHFFSELGRVIEQVGKDKGIDRQVIVDAMVEAILVAARKKYGTYREIEASFNEETGEIEVFEFKEVVERKNYVDEEIEIPLDEALKLDPGAQIGDSIGIRMESKDLGRIAAQAAKQVITQKVRDAEKEIIFNEFESRKGEIASGIVRRIERGAVVIDLGRTEAYIPTRDQIPGETYKPGDRVQGFLSEVRQTPRGPQIIMSRASEEYLVKLFEQEVPEIEDGIVEIMGAAREPGSRAKIAVRSRDNAVDPVGACVGMKGTRVQNIIQELRGEKIDIVNWNEDVTRFAANALAPAEISRIFMDEGNKELEVVVPDNHLSLAIGRRGQNVKLASKLTTWKIDILSESQVAARTAEAIYNLMMIPGMNETMAQSIFQSGFSSFKEIADSSAEDLMTIPGFEDSTKAQKLLADAKALVAKYLAEGIPVPTLQAANEAARAAASTGDAKSQADQRLKEELEKLKDEEAGTTSQEG